MLVRLGNVYTRKVRCEAEVLTDVMLKVQTFWDISLCRVSYGRRFE